MQLRHIANHFRPKIKIKDPNSYPKIVSPISYAYLLLEIMVENGFSASDILQKNKIYLILLNQLDVIIIHIQWSKLVWMSLILTKDFGLSYQCGLKLRITDHGSMSCLGTRIA